MQGVTHLSLGYTGIEPGKRRTLASAIGLTPRWLFAHTGWDPAYSSFLF